MYTDVEKNETAEQIATLLDHINNYNRFAEAIQEVALHELTPDDWELILNAIQTGHFLTETMKTMLTIGAQLIDNDALSSHIQASVSI